MKEFMQLHVVLSRYCYYWNWWNYRRYLKVYLSSKLSANVRLDLGYENTVYIHTTLLPYIGASHEVKTKPTQHSVKELRGLGIQPDFIVCRSEHHIEKELKDKISLFCNVPTQNVISNYDVENLYELPRMLLDQKMDDLVLQHLQINAPAAHMDEWDALVTVLKT